MRIIYKRIISLFCAAALLFVCKPPSVFAETEGRESVVIACTEIPLYAGEEYIGSGFLVDSVTYVPLLTFTEHMLGQDCTALWDQESNTATITADGLEMSLPTDREFMIVNGRYLLFEDGLYNVNGTILVPIRELAKVFSLGVEWDADNWAISIDNSRLGLFPSGEEFYNPDDLYWLSRVIFSEAGTQPMEGMIGVGNVVLNRLNDEYGSFGKSIMEVIFQPGQFDVVRNGTIYCEPSESAVIAAKLCMEGYNTVGESKWFLNPRIGISTWMWTYKTLHCSIADHEFYT